MAWVVVARKSKLWFVVGGATGGDVGGNVWVRQGTAIQSRLAEDV